MNITISPVGFVTYNSKYQKNYPNFCSGKDCFVKNNSIKQKLLDNNINIVKLDECCNTLSKHPDSVDDFLKYRNAAIEHKHYFVLNGEEISPNYIDCFFSSQAEQVLTAGKLLGDKNFIYSFHFEMDNFIKLINNIHLLRHTDYFDLLEEKINPKESKTYKNLSNSYLQGKNELLQLGVETGFNKIYLKNSSEIKDLKSKISQLKLSPTKENLTEIRQLQENIRYLKREIFDAKTPDYLQKEKQIFNIKSKLEQMDKDAIKDPQDIIAFCNIVFAMHKSKIDINEIRDVLKFNTKDEKSELYKYLNKKLLDFFNIDCDEAAFEKLKLCESEYFYKIFEMNEFVKNNLSKFLKILVKDPKCSAAQNLNKLPQNIKTKQIFEQNGLNYDLYINPDKNFSLNIKAKRHINLKDAVIKNVTTDIANFLSSDPETVSSHYREIIKSKLQENGFKLVDKNGDIQYDENSNRIISAQSPVMLYRNDYPASYKDILDLHRILADTIMDIHSFTDGSSLELLTFTHHIEILRTDEISAANCVYPQKEYDLKIKQIDMNDIKHSLFLGNQAHCCTAIGSGINQDSAIKYVKNKFMSGIEILDGDKSIGNTMMFFAKVDGKPSLIMDNIEMASEYQYMDEVRDGIIKFAKMLAARIGEPNMKIYSGAYDSKCDMSKYLFKDFDVKILGSSAKDEIYLDFVRTKQKIDDVTFRTYLYEIA